GLYRAAAGHVRRYAGPEVDVAHLGSTRRCSVLRQDLPEQLLEARDHGVHEPTRAPQQQPQGGSEWREHSWAEHELVIPLGLLVEDRARGVGHAGVAGGRGGGPSREWLV